jgi:hypothetical protein
MPYEGVGMRVSSTQLSLAALDRSPGVDAACLFITEDDRPLHGLAGLIDWRLCGMLSRVLKQGRFVGTFCDSLLMPGAGRIAVPRIFCIGAGPSVDLNLHALGRLMRRAADVLSLAGSKSFVTELPASAAYTSIEAGGSFLWHCAGAFKGDQIVLAGEAWSLLKELGGKALPPGVECDREPVPSAASPSPPRPKPLASAKAR